HEANEQAQAHRRAAGRGGSRPPPAHSEPDPPAAGPRHQSAEFRRDLEPGGPVQSRPGKPGTNAGEGGRADGDRRAGTVPIGNGQDAEPDAGDAAQMGGSTRAETGRGFIARLTGGAAWRVEPDTWPSERRRRPGLLALPETMPPLR